MDLAIYIYIYYPYRIVSVDDHCFLQMGCKCSFTPTRIPARAIYQNTEPIQGI
jgi:hypothetical protein